MNFVVVVFLVFNCYFIPQFNCGMIVQQPDKMMREESSSSRVSSPELHHHHHHHTSLNQHQLNGHQSSAALVAAAASSALYRPSAAAAAAAAALSMAGAFPFGPFGTLGGLRMLANRSSMHCFPPGMLNIRPLGSLLPFGLQHQQHQPSGSSTAGGSASPGGPRLSPAYPFPYSGNPSPFQPQPQQQQQQQAQQAQPQPIPSPSAGGGERGAASSAGTAASSERLLPHTPPTSPSLDENVDLNKTGELI